MIVSGEQWGDSAVHGQVIFDKEAKWFKAERIVFSTNGDNSLSICEGMNLELNITYQKKIQNGYF